MAEKDRLTLMDFVKRQGAVNIAEIYGEECLNEDGTVISFADQAAIITHYLKLQNSGAFAQPYEEKGKQFLKLWNDFVSGKPQCSTGSMAAEDGSLFLSSLFNDVNSSPFQNPSLLGGKSFV